MSTLLEAAKRKSHGRHTIRCPKCQTRSRVPESGDLRDLPTSFYLNGLIDVLAIRECKTSQVKCGNCDKSSSESSYCFHCCAFYCQDCVIGHNIMKSYKDHRVLALKEFQDKDYEDVIVVVLVVVVVFISSQDKKYISHITIFE